MDHLLGINAEWIVKRSTQQIDATPHVVDVIRVTAKSGRSKILGLTTPIRKSHTGECCVEGPDVEILDPSLAMDEVKCGILAEAHTNDSSRIRFVLGMCGEKLPSIFLGNSSKMVQIIGADRFIGS